MIYESGEETGGLIGEREPFHKTRITLRVGEKRAGNAREKERESAVQSLCMRQLVRWLWRGKKNITRDHLIAGHRMPPAKSPNPKAGFEQKKKIGRRVRNSMQDPAGDLAGDPTKTATRGGLPGRAHASARRKIITGGNL